MTPLTPDERKSLIAAAAKVFPEKTQEALADELDEAETLLAERFAREGATLPPGKEQRAKDLVQQFWPSLKPYEM
jgi:hypothetical protein